MISTPLFPMPEGLEITDITEINNVVYVHLISHRLISMCPTCSTPSSHIHSRYHRHPRDLPCSGRDIHLVLTVKKFFCRQAACVQKIFVERLPGILAVSSRLTHRLRTAIQDIGFTSTGKGGERLSAQLGMGTSDATILRSLFLRPLSTPRQPVEVVGIDDWSYRRGQRFGSIIVDLQAHTIVDVLPERSTESVIRWLHEHPEVHTISRDRGAVYVDGATQGAPTATQVCDRWHLLANLGDAVEAYLIRSPVRLPHATPVQPTTEHPLTAYSATPAQQRHTQARLLRKAYLAQCIHTLHAQGKSERAISRELSVARGTVGKYLRQPPEVVPPTPRPYRFSMLDGYDDLILDQLRHGCRNAAAIHQRFIAPWWRKDLREDQQMCERM